MKSHIMQAEVREAVVSIMSNNSDEVVCQSTNDGEYRHSLPASQNAVEEPSCSQRNHSSPQVVIIMTSFFLKCKNIYYPL